jgi:hypothetical protein
MAEILEPVRRKVLLSDHRLISTPHEDVIAPGQATNLIKDLHQSKGLEVSRGMIEIVDGIVLNDGLTVQVFSPIGVGAAELSIGPGLLRDGFEPKAELMRRIERASVLQRAISLVNVSQYNYFHFASQTLPSLALMRDQISDTLPVMLGGWHPGGNAFSRELMKILFPELNVIFLQVGQALTINELHGIPPLTTNIFEPCGLELIRERARSTSAGAGTPKSPSVVYLARGDNERNRRRLSNEAEVIALLERKWPDIQVLAPGRMPVIEQMRAVAGAEIIIGLHGAQLTNMIWAPRSATVIEIIPDDMESGSVFATLTRALGLNYRESESTGIMGAHWSVSDQTAVLHTLATAVQGI